MGADYRKINEQKKFCNEEIIEECVEELHLPKELIQEVVKLNSKFNRKVIETGAYESVTLPYLGKLKAKLSSVQKAASNIKRGEATV